MGFIHKLTPDRFEANENSKSIFGKVSDILHWRGWLWFKTKCHILCTEWESNFSGTNSCECSLLYVTKGKHLHIPESYLGSHRFNSTLDESHTNFSTANTTRQSKPDPLLPPRAHSPLKLGSQWMIFLPRPALNRQECCFPTGLPFSVLTPPLLFLMLTWEGVVIFFTDETTCRFF